MEEELAGSRRRQPRKKRAARADGGSRFNVRASEEELERLRQEAGDVGLSAYVRARLFGGRLPNRDVLRMIALLHLIGRQIERLADNPAADPVAISAALGTVRSTIGRLSKRIPGADDEDIPAP